MNKVSRVPHLRDGRIVAKVGFIRCLGILLACAAGVAQAQSCGLTSITETAQLVYPPIAKAAHAEGPVILLANFAQDGRVIATTTIQAPKFLEAAATTYVKGLHANPYTGPRQCPIVVTFRFDDRSTRCGEAKAIQHTDLQHISLTDRLACAIIQPSLTAAR